MREQTSVSGRSRASKEPLLISEVEEGFRVYSPDEPSEKYLVSGTPDAPTCNCPELFEHDADPSWRCKHIIAAFDQAKPMMERAADYQPAPRTRAKNAGAAPPQAAPDGPSQMLIKRSVSPDGRIDSLSVEFACPVEKSPVKDIKGRALTALQLQSEIIQSFLADRPRKDRAPEQPANGGDGAIAAELLTVGGMDTKWGRRLFISVQANGFSPPALRKPEAAWRGPHRGRLPATRGAHRRRRGAECPVPRDHEAEREVHRHRACASRGRPGRRERALTSVASTNDDETLGQLPFLSHSRVNRYLLCPEQYRLYYIEKLRPKRPAASLVFGQVMHGALAGFLAQRRGCCAALPPSMGRSEETRSHLQRARILERPPQDGRATPRDVSP
jgi:hypothetical protein